MRLIKTQRDLSEFLSILRRRGAVEDASVRRAVEEILAEVRANGDHAVLEYTRRFDHAKAKRLALTEAEIRRHADKADPGVVKALGVAAKRIRRFHEHQIERSWSFTDRETILGQIVRPLARVGVYVPGGKAAYPSTVLMNVIPAQVAGVREIALCVPAPGGELNPSVMAAARMLGVSEVYPIGGAQAIGALAYGTKTIRPVDKIVGPGNIYVAAAKQMVFGVVDIDMIAGPSEILVIADKSANASFVAADLLGQSEHDENASAILLTDSEELASRVAEEIDAQLERLARREIARQSLDAYGAIVVLRNITEAVRIANEIAPEHLEVMTAKPVDLIDEIENAGAIFLGPWTPEALGDYAAGPNHTLPTGGTARFSSPLGVYDFYKRSSLLGFTRQGFLCLSKIVETIADIEGLEGHGNTVRIRRARAMREKVLQIKGKGKERK